MDMRRMKPKQKPKVLPMDRRIKPNPKYENIKPVTDTGNNTRKQQERMEELRQFYKFRPDEIFRRVTVTSLVGLMLEVSKLEYQEEDEARSRKTSLDDLESHQDFVSERSEQEAELEPEPQLELEPEQEPEPSPEEAPQPQQEEVQEGEHEEAASSSDAGCDNDSLDGDQPQQKNAQEDQPKAAEPTPAENGDVFESVVHKGKMIKRTYSTSSQLHSSLGDLLSGVGDMAIHRPHHQQGFSNRAFHHQNSWNAASTFSYDDCGSSIAGRSEPLPPPPPRREAFLPEDPAPPAVVDRPFLLLDIRQPEDFERNHIVMARSYPANRLTRAVNFETKEMIHYKNKEGKLIIVYDYDESLAHKFATTMVQRGYDNVFMLSGGIRVTQIKFPNCLIKKGERKPNDPEERLRADEVHILESFLEEAHATGAGRMSSLSSVRLQSRLQSSLSNLPAIIGPGAAIPPSKRGLLHSPIRAPMRSSSIGRA